MNKPKSPPQVEADGLIIPLRRPEIAAFLAWLIPGAGHYYQRRYGKAALYSICILSIFILGMILGKGRVVYCSWTPEDPRWHYVCQAGVGLPTLPAAVQGWRSRNGKPPLFNGFMAKPTMPQLDQWHNETSSGFDLGCLYTMIAGLLNYLVIFDAYSGPLAMPGHDSRKKKDGDGKGKEEDDKTKEDPKPIEAPAK